MHPSSQLVREYAVRVLGELDEVARKQLLSGVELEDGMASFSTCSMRAGKGPQSLVQGDYLRGA